jgi:glycosyltransferase involved in cell wall biosynthesis
MQKKIDASIIITTYNRPHYLERAIKSCLSQNTVYNYEIIVIDDNGLHTAHQQQTETLVSQYLHQINYLPLATNSGACVARNHGIDHAKGKYIFFLDDDDEYLPSKVQNQVQFLENNIQYDGCLSGFKRLDFEGKPIISSTNYPTVGSFQNFVIQGNFFTPMLCIRKSSLDAIGGFDDIPRFQDRYLMIKALANKQKFFTTNEDSYILHEHNGERITHSNLEKTFKSLDKIKKKVMVYKFSFDKRQWRAYLISELRIKATALYISNHRKDRIKAAKLFAVALVKSYEKEDLVNTLKSLIKTFF